jgi:diaminopimelate decarboxylase
VRAELSSEIAAAIERCIRPSLVFDLAQLEANVIALADAAAHAGITPLFAAKSFPHPAVHAMAAARLAGFDVGSPGELAVAIEAALPGHILSIADPSGRAIAEAARWRGRLIVSCETVAQVVAAPRHAEIALRISASITGSDPAIGAVLDGTGHRRSRFGLDVAPVELGRAIGELARAAAPRPIGLHVHHGAVAATSAERFIATAKAVLAAAATAGIEPRFVDLGGAWHAVADLPAALRAIRAALPPPLELFIEPGRRIAAEAGFACGRVASARTLEDRELRVIELSRICHLRWSQPALVAPPPRTGAGRATLFVGPTCYEDDALGEWTVEPDRVAAGAQAVFRNITGYAVAWNTGFGGVPPADVVMVSP